MHTTPSPTRRTALALGGATLALPFLACPARAATSWVFYTVHRKGSPGVAVWQAMADAVKAATSGAFEITVVPAGHIGIDANAITAAVTSGAIALGDDSYYAQTIVAAGVPRLPLLVPSRVAFARGAKAMKTYLRPVYDARNAILLGYTYTPRLRTWSRLPFDNFAGLGAQRIRVITPEQGEFVRRLGAAPITLPTAAMPHAFETGAVDAIFGFAETAATTWRKYLRAAYAGGPNHLDSVLIVNKTAFQALAKPSQDALIEQVARAEAGFSDAAFDREAAAIARLAADGLELAEQQSDDILAATNRMAQMWTDWTRVRGPEAQDLLLAFRRAMEGG